MPDCIFCSPQNLVGHISENEFFFWMFDKNPVTPGHAIVIPKEHTLSLLDLPAEHWAALHDALKLAVNAVHETNLKDLYTQWIEQDPENISLPFWKSMLEHVGITKKPDAYNFGNNDGPAAGRVVNHLHVHVIPRYIGDLEDPTGGLRRMFGDKGHYKL